MHTTKRFFAPLETNPAETRATVAPTTVTKLCALGLEVLIQAGAGTQSDYSDAEYEKAGATIVPDADTGYAQADIVARVSKPSSKIWIRSSPAHCTLVSSTRSMKRH